MKAPDGLDIAQVAVLLGSLNLHLGYKHGDAAATKHMRSAVWRFFATHPSVTPEDIRTFREHRKQTDEWQKEQDKEAARRVALFGGS